MKAIDGRYFRKLSNVGKNLYILASVLGSIGTVGVWIYVWLFAIAWANGRIVGLEAGLYTFLMIVLAITCTILIWNVWKGILERQKPRF